MKPDLKCQVCYNVATGILCNKHQQEVFQKWAEEERKQKKLKNREYITIK